MKFASLTVAALLVAGGAHAQDAANGEKVFKKCLQCHAVGADAKNKIGPVLNGVVDGPIGVAEGPTAGFVFSEAMKNYGKDGKKWDEATLDTYLADPKGVVPGNKMAFVGLKKDTDRKDVIAYLKTQK